jgi:hypothetical protein
MPRGKFEPLIPVFEWAKKFWALDRAANVIAVAQNLILLIIFFVTCIAIVLLLVENPVEIQRGIILYPFHTVVSSTLPFSIKVID